MTVISQACNPRKELVSTSRLTTFHGTREEVLERLPSVCPRERMELGTDRISLVAEAKRVDVLFRAEVSYCSHNGCYAILLVELEFTGKSEPEVDTFMHRFQYGHNQPLH